eukprot:Tbor_TRINITY_DN5853_c1_g1::TRINITY_DN5853_c1_g1_i1::g.7032::m.7032
MNMWSEVFPEGSNIWIIPREMYDCVCLCIMNKSETDAMVEIDFSASRNVIPMSKTHHSGPTHCDAPCKRTTVALVLAPERPGVAMDVSFRAFLVGMASVEGAREVDTNAMRVLQTSVNQSAEVDQWLSARRQKLLAG